MNCSKCKVELHCCCESCVNSRLKKEESPVPVYLQLSDGDDIMRCSHCNHSGHIDQWLDWNYQQIKEENEKISSV